MCWDSVCCYRDGVSFTLNYLFYMSFLSIDPSSLGTQVERRKLIEFECTTALLIVTGTCGNVGFQRSYFYFYPL